LDELKGNEVKIPQQEEGGGAYGASLHWDKFYGDVKEN